MYMYPLTYVDMTGMNNTQYNIMCSFTVQQSHPNNMNKATQFATKCDHIRDVAFGERET